MVRPCDSKATVGAYQTNVSCKIEGKSCSRDGSRHDQLFVHEYVPNVIPAAKIEPTYQLSLKRPVMTARSLGYANSEMSCDAPLMAYTIPIPRIILDTINIATFGRLLVLEIRNRG